MTVSCVSPCVYADYCLEIEEESSISNSDEADEVLDDDDEVSDPDDAIVSMI